MGNSESEPPVPLSSHFKVIVEILKCNRVEIPVVTTTQAPQQHIKPPLIKNVLGENLYASLQDFFRADEASTTNDATIPVERIVRKREDIKCEFFNGYNFVVSDMTDFVFFITLFSLLVITVICFAVIVKRKIKQKLVLKTKNLDQTVDSRESELSKHIDTAPQAETPKQSVSEDKKIYPEKTLEDTLTKIPLAYQLRSKSANVQKSQFHLSTFLANISETLFSKLDQLLLKDQVVDQTRGHATIATPRLARRSLHNRQRIGSTPSLTAFASTSDESHTSFIERKQAWGTFKKFAKETNWKQPDYFQFEDSKFNRKNQRLIHYYQRVCPIKSDHWKVTAFLTNFTLFLLQSEKEYLVCQNGYRFLGFIPSGSGRMGSMVGRPNQFDVLMVLQSPVSLTQVICDDKTNTLPSGHILIEADLLNETSVATRETTCFAKFGKEKLICLSAREFSRSAGELIEIGIQSLYTKTRSLMDRLPFVIRRSPTENLCVSVDTRSLVGLGLPEIKINIVPVLPLALNGWYQTGTTYAMPIPEDLMYKSQAPTVSAISQDCLWQVNCDEINALFMQGVESKMKHAGVDSCHELCLMILKTLFTGKGKNSLLDKGFVHSFILSNTVNFLLLESSAQQWSVDSLSDRFSDLVHFLRSAFRNGRLPNFYINNPHLIDRMPAVAANEILTRKKQHNLLAVMTRERLDKCMDYMESSISDAGLTDCIKGEYSDDMWEYEFFIFN